MPSTPTLGQSTSATEVASAAALVLTLNTVLVGSTILVGVISTSATVTYTVSDGINTYLSAVGPTGPSNQTAQWFYAKNVAAGNYTVTLTPSISTTHFGAMLEIRGADHTTPIQANQPDSVGVGAATFTGTSINTNTNNTYAVQMIGSFSPTVAPNTQTISAPWAQEINTGSLTAGSSRASMTVADQPVAVSGSAVQAASVDSRSSETWVSLVLLLNPSSSSFARQVGAFLVGF
jgi:hypothetical protein